MLLAGVSPVPGREKTPDLPKGPANFLWVARDPKKAAAVTERDQRNVAQKERVDVHAAERNDHGEIQ